MPCDMYLRQSMADVVPLLTKLHGQNCMNSPEPHARVLDDVNIEGDLTKGLHQEI